MCIVREIFRDGQKRDRESALHDVAQRLGYDRVGPRIRETLAGDLIAAARRGVIENRGSELVILCRSIEDYQRGFLKEQFLASIGRTWTEREKACRSFARVRRAPIAERKLPLTTMFPSLAGCGCGDAAAIAIRELRPGTWSSS